MCGKLKISKLPPGVSIVEVVIASALLITAMIPIIKSLAIAHATSTKIELKTHSLVLAQAKLDEIKAKSIYDFTNSDASFTENNTSLDGSYLCNVTDDSSDSLKTISVSVGYDANGDSSLGSGEVQVTLTTLLARRWPD